MAPAKSRDQNDECRDAFAIIRNLGSGDLGQTLDAVADDLRWLRRRRRRAELIINRVIIGLVSLLVGGLGVLLWVGLQHMITG